jgi:hypothetical protein
MWVNELELKMFEHNKGKGEKPKGRKGKEEARRRRICKFG